MNYTLPQLPIHQILPEITKSLANNRSLVLAAEPGSGKTTIVPLSLTAEPYLRNKKIIMLEPRRLAARMAARRMSELAGSSLGDLVGYRIRFDKQVSANTRIEVVTEGIFIRMIQNDPGLQDVALVIFDEFHLRSIQSDLALALCLDMLSLRDNLKIMVMSATIDSSRVARILDNAPVITGKGRCFPVHIQYLKRATTDYPVQRAVKAIHHSLACDSGDILVFLPGAGEIKAVQSQIPADILCSPLYGDLPQRLQDMVFTVTDKRRVILATPIAETSLTIEGITVVIDSGLMKTPFFSPANGLTSLTTVNISKASAEQRSGRAGRTREGKCYRLWLQDEHHSRPDFLPPEITAADLAPLLIELLQWGVSDPDELTWLDPPRRSSVERARKLLRLLGAIDNRGILTRKGRKLGSLPLHPRLALMLLHGKDRGQGVLACRLAALLQNRDLFRGNRGQQSSDIEDRLDILTLLDNKHRDRIQAMGADLTLCRRILREAKQYQRILNINNTEQNSTHSGECGTLLAIAYPDRIAMKKKDSRQHLLSSGRGVKLPEGDPLHRADFLVAAMVDGGRKQGRIFLAAALNKDDIVSDHNHLLTKEERVEWKNSRVEANAILSLGSLEISRETLCNADPERVTQCLLEGIRQQGTGCLNWQKKSRELQARLQTAQQVAPSEWPDVSDSALIEDLSWLSPYLGPSRNLKQLRKIDIHGALLSLLSWDRKQMLDQLLPTHYQAPSGSKIRLQYQAGKPPVIAVRLQEMFGETETPLLYNGNITVLIHLLSPARRPVQVTADLASFWQTTYPAVKKELSGRYPKHYWPDDPLSAAATARCKPRK